MIFDDLREKYPHFTRVAHHLEETSALLMGKPLQQLREAEPNYDFAEKLCRDAYALCGGDEERVFDRAREFVELSMEFLYLQRKLERSGQYLYRTFLEVEEQVYNDPERKRAGAPYMWALYFSQVFWITHGRVWQFFLDEFATQARGVGGVLEVPSGNGLFLAHFLLQNPNWSGLAVDLSDTAIEFATEVLSLNGVRARAEVKKEDFFRLESADGFDRIVCGEFLEHVEDPFSVLRRLNELLAADGRLFLTVAVWAANIDHIYLYESAEQVRDHIRASGFEIEREVVQNVFGNKRPDEARTPINYSAILRCSKHMGHGFGHGRRKVP